MPLQEWNEHGLNITDGFHFNKLISFSDSDDDLKDESRDPKTSDWKCMKYEYSTMCRGQQ